MVANATNVHRPTACRQFEPEQPGIRRQLRSSGLGHPDHGQSDRLPRDRIEYNPTDGHASRRLGTSPSDTEEDQAKNQQRLPASRVHTELVIQVKCDDVVPCPEEVTPANGNHHKLSA